MKQTYLNYQILAFIFSLLALGCTKVIELPIGNQDKGKLVIEGEITNESGLQTVKLSQNVPFYDQNIYPAVSGAIVTLSDQAGASYSLTEGPTGTYTTNTLIGLVSNTYTMQVVTNGLSYTASSTMPALVTLDNITAKNSVFDKTKKTITVYYQDPAGIANYYRFVLYVNGVQVKGFFPYNDTFTDGKPVRVDIRQTDMDIRTGATVTVEMHCIDKTMYTYWYTLASQSVNGPGGGVAPTNPPNTISPAALGYFSAHTSQRKTIIVD